MAHCNIEIRCTIIVNPNQDIREPDDRFMSTIEFATLSSCFVNNDISYTTFILTRCLVNYKLSKTYPPSSRDWRIPSFFSAYFGGTSYVKTPIKTPLILMLSDRFCPESMSQVVIGHSVIINYHNNRTAGKIENSKTLKLLY